MLVLDTDHLSLVERRGEAGDRLRDRLHHAALNEPVVATVISYEEQMRGWMAYLGKARTIAAQVEAYGRLLQHLNNYCEIAILAFDEVAAAEFQRLKKLRPRLAAMDLKIAAVALSNNATLLTRNRQDFGQIPDLKIEDWTA